MNTKVNYFQRFRLPQSTRSHDMTMTDVTNVTVYKRVNIETMNIWLIGSLDTQRVVKIKKPWF